MVLPFKNLSGDPSQDYFADGITENLTTDLSRIRNSFVIANSTANTYKGKAVDAKEIGKELGVRFVLEGSVNRDQNRVRVNAQLVDAESGAHLWADRFEEDVAGLFKLQDQVVARLATTLGFELVKAEAERSARSSNPDALDLASPAQAGVDAAAAVEWWSRVSCALASAFLPACHLSHSAAHSDALCRWLAAGSTTREAAGRARSSEETSRFTPTLRAAVSIDAQASRPSSMRMRLAFTSARRAASLPTYLREKPRLKRFSSTFSKPDTVMRGSFARSLRMMRWNSPSTGGSTIMYQL